MLERGKVEAQMYRNTENGLILMGLSERGRIEIRLLCKQAEIFRDLSLSLFQTHTHTHTHTRARARAHLRNDEFICEIIRVTHVCLLL